MLLFEFQYFSTLATLYPTTFVDRPNSFRFTIYLLAASMNEFNVLSRDMTNSAHVLLCEKPFNPSHSL